MNPLIVVSVGTDHHPFDRLVSWMASWSASHPSADVFVQYGTARPPRGGVVGAALVPHGELLDAMSNATAVVSHGGPATVADARSAGLRPLVVPRRPELGEHVDDHQVRFARHLAAIGDAVVVETEAALQAELAEAVADPTRMRLAPADRDARAAVERFAVLVDELQPRRRARKRVRRLSA